MHNVLIMECTLMHYIVVTKGTSMYSIFNMQSTLTYYVLIIMECTLMYYIFIITKSTMYFNCIVF